MFKIAVLASGSGSNLQAILDSLHRKVAGIEVALVVTNVPGVQALSRAEAAGVPTAVFPLMDYRDRSERDRAMADAVAAAEVDLVVLAGYMQLLTPAFLARFPWAVINLHPALLPSFPGTHSIRDAVERGVKVTGVTVHFVDEGEDTGPIIRQQAVPVFDRDTEESLAARIHAVEHQILPRVIELIARGKVTQPRPGTQTVFVEDEQEGQ